MARKGYLWYFMLQDTVKMDTGVHRDAGSRYVTATEKKFTGKKSRMEIEGVLFLAAGYGRRDEPLSLIHPKALLPYGKTSILGRLARQVSVLRPGRVRINAVSYTHLTLPTICSV